MTPELLREFNLHCEIIDGTGGSRNERRQLKKDLRRLMEQGLRLPNSQLSPAHRWNLCSARLRDGNFTNWDGWEFRSDWAMTFKWGEKRPKIPLWDGSPKNHLVIGGEQGIGDEILFLSALPDLMVRVGKKCLEFQTYPRLQKIVERSYGIKCTDRKPLNEITEGDAFIALGDLFPWYRRDQSHFPRKPFLKPDPEKVEYWKQWLKTFGPEPKIGLGWYSRHGFIEPKDLINDWGHFFDLQYDCKIKAPPYVIKPPFDVRDDFENLFAFVSCLDRVQTCTQTLVHVSGSLGVETHAIIPPKNGEVNWHLWYHHGRNPEVNVWDHLVYPNVTVYRTIDEFRNRST